MKRKNSSHLTLEVVKAAHAEGITLRELCKRVHLPEATVSSAIRRMEFKWSQNRPKMSVCKRGHARSPGLRCGPCAVEQSRAYRSRKREEDPDYRPMESKRRHNGDPVAVPLHSWIGWLEQCTREESYPAYLRGKAAEMKRWLVEHKVAQ